MGTPATQSQPKRRGRPPGSGMGKIGPRIGSRPWALLRLQPGERIFLEVRGSVASTMQQIGTDVQRNGLGGKITQTLVLGVVPSSRDVIDLVMLTRLPD